MIFATDLDRTMIFSKRFLDRNNKNLTIGFKDGKGYSYFTKKQKQMLKDLETKIIIIPCTTRSKEEFERVPFFNECSFAIYDNGASIKIGDDIDYQWQFIMQENMRMCFKDLLEKQQDLETKDFVIKEVKLVDNYFLFSKTDNIDKCRRYLEATLDKSKFYYSISSTKFYIFPNFISKKHALQYITDKIGDTDIIVAGDSDVDFQMIDLATKKSFIPLHDITKTISLPENVIIVKEKGLFSGEIILDNIYKILESEEKKND